MGVDLLGEGVGDAVHRLDVLERRHGDGAGAAEMVQQGALAAGADAVNLVERRAREVGARRANADSSDAPVAQALQK
jgi:hypothetical protein